MSCRKLLLLSVFLFVNTGCWVNSLNPSYETADLVSEPAFVGAWVHRKPATPDTSKAPSEDPSEGSQVWTLTVSNGADPWLGPTYNVLFSSQECNAGVCNSEKPLEWTGHLARIGKNLFLDLVPKGKISGDFHWIPTHTINRISLDDTSLQVNGLDDEWLDRAVTDGRLKLTHYHLGGALAGSVLLTNETPVVRKFLLDFGSDPEAFPEQNKVIFKRDNR